MTQPIGMCRYERRIMDRWDAGMSIEKIAIDLGHTRNAVSKVVQYLDGDDQDRRETAIKHGSATLLAALAAAR